MKRLSIVWISWCAIIVVGMVWYDTHLPKCLDLYGVGSAHDSVDLFIACQDENMGQIFMAQAMGLAAMVLVPAVAILCAWLLGKVFSLLGMPVIRWLKIRFLFD